MPLMPTITAYGSRAVRSGTLRLIGYGFGRVVSAGLQDVDTLDLFTVDHIVDNGNSVTITVPKLLPDGTYTPYLQTLDGTSSTNTAGTLIIPDPLADEPPSPPPAAEPVPDPASPAVIAIRKRLRLEIGDYAERFRSTVEGDGRTSWFDLPDEVINLTGLTVTTTVEGGSPTVLSPSDYDLDAQQGVIAFAEPLADDTVLTVTGSHYQFFTDEELDLFIRSAALKHTHNAEALQVYQDGQGFRRYLYSNATVDTVAPVEYHLLALLAATEALEVIRSDAAYDIDVQTAEGTSLPRSQRFGNIGQLIAIKRAAYDEMAMQLGVGLGRIEVFTLRRVSRTTGRLVPVIVSREFDDRRHPPLRLFAPRNLGITGSGFVQPDRSFNNGSNGL